MTLIERALRGECLKDLNIIDSHAHLGYIHPCHINAPTAEDMLKSMDTLGTSKCAISSFLAIGPDVKKGNDEVAAVLRNHPNRFIGYGVVNPRHENEILPELTRCFDELRMTAIKLHPAFQNYSIQEPMCTPVFEFANERGCAILSHNWGSPDFIAQTAEKYPKIKIIPAHVVHDGFKYNLTELLTVARDHDNVFLDLTFSIVPYENVEKIVDIAGADKVLYGSDCPMMAMSFQIGKVLFADLDDEDKIKILSGNAKRIFGLD